MADSEVSDRLARVKKRMRDAGVDALWVRSTDRYLNEYVPEEDSTRIWISGFTGSMGEVLITKDRAYLAVDGRYWLQAEKQTDPKDYEILRAGLGTGIDDVVADKLVELARKAHSGRNRLASGGGPASPDRDPKSGRNRLASGGGPASPDRDPKSGFTVGFEPDRFTPTSLAALKHKVGDVVEWKALYPSPVEAALNLERRPKHEKSALRAVDETRLGKSSEEKLSELAKRLEALSLDALLVQRLDEIAYLSNLRGDELPYQVTFKSIALATKDAFYIGIDPARVSTQIRKQRTCVRFVPEPELWSLIGKKAKRTRIGFDPSGNTEHARAAIEELGATTVNVESPVGPMKAKKNKAELAAMTAAFARADLVVDRAVRWLCGEVSRGKKVTEADFAEQVRAYFDASGAVGLSFRVISAAGKNGAIIHYSEPSSRRAIKKGELMLLDTGAYYEEGYATDLTRTFLVDGPSGRGTDEQRRYFTLVLKAAIAGMTAVLPEGARGGQLDAIVRAPLWAEGLNFNHGTGHGVGINVHEFPPRIGPNATSVLEEGFVFSIEPGVYLPSFGGVRIENLCTLEKTKEMPGFMRVVPLTFSPLDKRLIEPKLLTPFEKAYLTQYSKVHVSPSRKRLRAEN